MFECIILLVYNWFDCRMWYQATLLQRKLLLFLKVNQLKDSKLLIYHYRCLESLLHNWNSLKVYFKEQKDVMTAKGNQVPTGKKSSKDSSEPSGKKTKKDSENSGKTTKNEPLDVAPTYHEPSYAEKKVDKILSFLRSPTNSCLYCF